MGKSGAFAVGPTVKATTKGIWVWGRALSVEGSDTTVLFLDSEGLGSTVRSETYDARIFALALLLSSYFIYNSFGTIDGAAIAKLSLVVNLTKHIHVRSGAGRGGEDPGTEFNQFFPSFLWVVRDFAVKLERDGRRISARDYLEDALRPEDGVSEATEAKNAVRMLLRNFFPERDCVTMVRPVSDERSLAALSGVPWDGLRPEFRAQIEAMRKRVFAAATRPKALYGKPLNGAMLASLADAYVAALNSGGTPTISSAWDRVVDTQCSDAVDSAVAAYVSNMHAALAAAAAKATAAAASAGDASRLQFNGSTARPAPVYAAESTIVEEESVHEAHSAASLAAMTAFAAAAVQDSEKTPQYEARLRVALEEAHSRLRRANDDASSAWCLELLEQLHSRLGTAMRDVTRRAAGAAAPATSSGDATEAVAVAASRLLRAASVVGTFRSALGEGIDAYTREARGPAARRVLADFLAARATQLLSDAAAAADASVVELDGAHRSRADALGAALAEARAREVASAEALVAERAASASALATASRTAAAEASRLSSSLEDRSAELARLSARFDALLASADAASVRAHEAAENARVDLADAHRRIDELANTKLALLLDAAAMAVRLADAEAARGDAERLASDSVLRLATESRAGAVLAERCRAAENETVRLREGTELLYESVRVQKDLLAAKTDEFNEIEWQLGVSKGKLAQAESERLAAQAELDAMAGLAAALKAALLATNKGRLPKGVTFSRSEQRAFDALPTAGAEK